MKVKIDTRNSVKYINKEGKRITEEVVKKIINDSRALSMKMQADMDKSIDLGPVAFTKRSMLFFYNRRGAGVTTTIMIKDVQARYLYDILLKPSMINKFVPTSGAKLDRFGNINGLRRNIKSGRYKVVKQKGKERMIDTNAKKGKRVIGLREEKRRKMVYDFYRNGEKGAMLIIKDIKGTFKVRKG